MGSVGNKSADMEEDKVYGFVDLFKSVGDAKPVHIYQLSMRKIKIGREQKCDIRIHNLRISRIQCAIKVSGIGETQQVRLQNLTTKATTVYKNEGIPQNSTVVLQDGDRFRLYDTELRFRAFNPNETNGFPESSDGRNPPIIRLSDREKTHTPEKSSLYKKSPRSEKSRPSRSSTRVNDRMNKSVDSSDKTPKRRKSSDLNLRKSVILKSFRKSVQGKNFPPDIPENPELIELEDDDDEDGEEVGDDETETTQQSEEPMEIDEDEADTQTSTEPDPIEIVKPRNSNLSNNSVRCAQSPEDLIHLSPLVQSPPGGELSEDLIQFHDIEREMSLLHGEESANNLVENEDDSVVLNPASGLLEPVSPSTVPISDSSEPDLSLPLVADTPASSPSQVALKPAPKKNSESVTVANISEPNSVAVTSEDTGDVNISGNSDEESENQSIHESCTQVVDLQETLNLDGKSYYTAADEDEHGDLCIDESHLLNDDQHDRDLNKTATSDKSDDAEDVFEDAQGDENGTESNDLFEDSVVHEAVDSIKAGTLANGESEDVELIDGGIEILADGEKGPESNDQNSSNQSLHSSKDLLQSNDDELADEDEQSHDEQDEEVEEEPEVVDIADDSSENEDNDNANNYSLDSDDGLESELIDLVDSPEILSVDSPHEPLPDISPEDVESIPVADSPSPVGSEELQDCIPVVNESDNDKESSSAVDKDVEDTEASISTIESTPLVLSDTDISGAANSCGVDKIAIEVALEVEPVIVTPVAPDEEKKDKSVNSAGEGAVADEISAIEDDAEAPQSSTANVTDGDGDGSDKEVEKPDGDSDDELAEPADKVVTKKDVVFVNTEEISLENEEADISGVEKDVQNLEKSAIEEPEKTDANLVEEEPAEGAGDKTPHEEITEAQKGISSSRIDVSSTVVDSDSDIEDDLKSVSDFNGGTNELEENENISVPVPVTTENAQDSVSGKPSSSSNRVEAMEIEDNKENIVEPISDDADSENDMVEQLNFRAGSGRISSKNDKNKSSTPKKQSSLIDNIVNKNHAVKDCSVVLSRIIIQVDTADLSDDGEPEDVIPQINDAEAVFSDLTNEPLSSALNATAKPDEVCVINETPEAIFLTPKKNNQVSISQSIQVNKSKISTPTSSRHTREVSPIATSTPQVSDDVSVVASDDKILFPGSEPSIDSSLILSEQLGMQSKPDFNLTGTRAASLSKTLEIPSDPLKLLSEGETPVTSEVNSKTVSESTPKRSVLISPVSTPKDLATSSPSLSTPIVAEKSISSTPAVKNCSIVIERLSISTEDGSILATTPTPRSKNKTLNTSRSTLESPKSELGRPKSSVRQLQESSDITKTKQRGRKKASDIELVNLEEPETEDEMESNEVKSIDSLTRAASNKKVVDDLEERKEPASSTSRAVRTRTELDETRVSENSNLTPKRGRPKILKEKEPEPKLEMDTENTNTRKGNSKKDTEDSADESESDQVAKPSPRRGRPRKDQETKSDNSAAEKILEPSVSSGRILPRSRREVSESEEGEADKFVKPLRSPIRARVKNRRQISESEESEADKFEKPSMGRGRPKRQPAVVASESEAESDADKIVKPSPGRGRPKRQPAVASESEVESDADKIVKSTPGRGRPKRQPAVVASESEAESDADKIVKSTPGRGRPKRQPAVVASESEAESDADKIAKSTPGRGRPKRQPAVVASESEVESDVDRVVKASPDRGRPKKNKTTSEFDAEGDAVVIVLEDDSDKDSDALHLPNKDDQLKSKRGRESEDESRQTEKKRKVKRDSPQREPTTRQADENVHLEEQKASGRKTRGQARNEDIEEIPVSHRRGKQAESSTSKRRGGAAKRDELESVSDSESEQGNLPKSKLGRYDNEVQTESNTMKNVISKGKPKSQPHLKDSKVSGRQVNIQPLENIQDSDEEEVFKPVVKLSRGETVGAKKESRSAVKDMGKTQNNRKPVEVEENEDDEEGGDAPPTSGTRGGRRARTKDGSQLVVALTHVEEGVNLESPDTENVHTPKTKVEAPKATNKDKNRKVKAAIAPPLPTSTSKGRGNRKNAIEEVHLSEDEDADTDSGVEQNELPSRGPHYKATTAKISNKSINEGSTTSRMVRGQNAQPVVLLECIDDETEKMGQQRKRNRIAARKANVEEESDDDKVKRKSPPKRGRTRKGGENAGPSNPEPKQPSRPKRLRRHESTDMVIEQPEKEESADSEENSDSDGEPVVHERIASAVKPDATAIVRSDRGRFRGVNKVPVHEPSAPVVDSEDEVEPATKTRRARLQSKEELKEREKNVASAKVTKGKSFPGKKEVEKAPLGDVSDEEEEEQQTTASRKNNKKVAEGTSSKARANVKPALRRGRQAKGVEMEVEESSDDEAETFPEPLKPAEPLSSKTKAKTTIKPARLGRQAKVTESKVEESSDDEVEAVPKPEPPKSAKPSSSKSKAKATIKPARVGRQAKVTEAVVEESSDDEVEAVPKPEPPKSAERPTSKSKAKITVKPVRGGRQAKVTESKVEESSDDEVEAVPEPEPPKSAKRPISKPVKTVTKPRRGRQAKVPEAEVKESSDDEVETVPEPEPAKSAERPSSKSKAKTTVKPSHRGRQAKVVEAEVEESSDDEAEIVQEPEPPKSAKRGVKRTKAKKNTSNSEQASDNDITSSGVTKKTSKSSKKESSTKGKSQKVQIVQKAPKDRVVLQLPDTDDDVIELSSDEEPEPSVSPVAKRLRTAPKVPTPAKTRATKPARPAKHRRGKK